MASRDGRRRGEAEPVLSGSVLLLVAAQGILPDEAGIARVAAEGAGGVQFGVIPGARGLGRLAAAPPFAALSGFPRVALLSVDGQVAALFGGEAAEVTREGPLLRVDPLVHSEGPPAGAGVRTGGAPKGLDRPVLPRVRAQRRLAGGPEVALEAVVGVVGAVLDLNVRLQVAFHGAAVVAEVTLVGFLARVNPDVSLQVRVNFELGVALLALERCVASTGPRNRPPKTRQSTVSTKKEICGLRVVLEQPEMFQCLQLLNTPDTISSHVSHINTHLETLPFDILSPFPDVSLPNTTQTLNLQPRSPKVPRIPLRRSSGVR